MRKKIIGWMCVLIPATIAFGLGFAAMIIWPSVEITLMAIGMTALLFGAWMMMMYGIKLLSEKP